MNAIQKIKNKAEQLAELRSLINATEDHFKAKIDPLKSQRDAIQQELLDELKKNELLSIKTSSGENYIRSSKKVLGIVSLPQALKWAKENMAFSIDKRIALQKITKMDKAPDGFDLEEREYISIRKPKEQ